MNSAGLSGSVDLVPMSTTGKRVALGVGVIAGSLLRGLLRRVAFCVFRQPKTVLSHLKQAELK